MHACIIYNELAGRILIYSLCAYFILLYKFPNLLTSGTSPSELGQLEDQMMSNSEIPSSIWESVEDEQGHHWMDIIWGYMNNMKSPDSSSCFQN